MTDSATRERAGKRERLIASATELLARQGAQATTLAEIAEAADVPPGNVYYYFKTRDDLVRAVIEARTAELHALLDSLEQRPSPRARLKGLVRNWMEARDEVAEHGCPIGSLCSELNKQHDGLDREAAQLVAELIDWSQAQFRALGRRDARELAVTFLAVVQGAALLSNTLRDPAIMSSQVRRLERWVDSVE
jgi:AcrR family transcriptional regulator